MLPYYNPTYRETMRITGCIIYDNKPYLFKELITNNTFGIMEVLISLIFSCIEDIDYKKIRNWEYKYIVEKGITEKFRDEEELRRIFFHPSKDIKISWGDSFSSFTLKGLLQEVFEVYFFQNIKNIQCFYLDEYTKLISPNEEQEKAMKKFYEDFCATLKTIL